jgi:hypothetical protein
MLSVVLLENGCLMELAAVEGIRWPEESPVRVDDECLRALGAAKQSLFRLQ